MSFEEKIISLIKENIEGEVEISLDSDLNNDLAIDSFGMLMIINAIEDEFSITIKDTEFEGINTVADIVKNLRDKYPGIGEK